MIFLTHRFDFYKHWNCSTKWQKVVKFYWKYKDFNTLVFMADYLESSQKVCLKYYKS